MKVTILGCGTSNGTPAAGGFWGKCDPEEPKNHRTRSSILVQSAETNILVDTTVDLRLHLNRMNLKNLDGVLISHSHSDHVNGIDDLRTIAYHRNQPMDIFSNKETLVEIERRWPYVLKTSDNGVYVEFVKMHEIGNFQHFRVGDIEVESFEQDHGVCNCLGFRFGKFAYSVDMMDLSEKALQRLEGLDVWVVDAASYHRDSVTTHANIKRVKAWVERLKPKMTYLTVLSTHMDYNVLCEELPPHIRPAYDGLEIDLESNRR